MPCKATQGGRVIVKSPDKIRSTGEGNSKPLQYSCCKNPMNRMKRQKDMTPEDESSGSKDVWYATGEEQRTITKSSRKKESFFLPGPKQKELSVVDVSGGEKPKMEKLYTVSKIKTRN